LESKCLLSLCVCSRDALAVTEGVVVYSTEIDMLTTLPLQDQCAIKR
jgi:hypothetical protein